MNSKIMFSLLFLLLVSIVSASIIVEPQTTSIGSSVTFNISYTHLNNLENVTFSLEPFIDGSKTLNDNFSTETIEMNTGENKTFMIQVEGEYSGNYIGIFNAGNESKTINLTITQADLSTPSTITLNGKPNEVVALTFKIANTGTENLENLTITTTLSNYTISPTNFDLNITENKTITLELALIKSNLGTITISNSKINKTINVEGELETGIKIKSLEVEVDGKKDRNVKDGEIISKDAQPGDEIIFGIELENTLEQDLKDISIEITLEDINGGDDKEIDKDKIDIDSRDDDSFDLSYIIPYQLDDDKYTIRIHVEGEDENGSIHELDWKIYLEIDKERHQVVVEDIYLSPNSVSCSQSSELRINLANAGENEEDVRVVITNEELNLDRDFTVSLDRRGRDATRNLKEVIKTNEPGTYPIDITVYRDNDQVKSETLTLNVKSCGVKTNTEEKKKNEVIEIINEQTNEQTPKQNFRESNSYLWILGAIVIILLFFILLILKI